MSAPRPAPAPPFASPLSEAEFAALMAPFAPLVPPLVVGCSGGADSLALAWLAHRWSGGRTIAVICDHGLRPESAAEAEQVAERLRGAGLRVALRRLRLAPGPALQARARLARRAALLAACREFGAPHLLLGHHAGDQAETVVMRALAGSGPRGLAGMAPLAVAPEALVLRPLLGIPRARLEASCRAAGLLWVEDPSNADPRFARARLRAAGGAEGAEAAAPAFAARRAREEAALAARAAACLRLLPEGCARLDLAALGRDATAAALLGRVLRVVAGRAHAPAEARAAALLARGQGTLGGARLLASGWVVREAPSPPCPATPGALWDGRFRLLAAAEGLLIGPLGAAEAARLRARHRHLPAAALAALPALRHARDGMLAAVPHLAYPGTEAAARFPLRFAPRGGPLLDG
ncbi:tRNA lysidine(34) synthetase TilS [Rubritepida flocculans]|uniref:tRNA lysidine(34) synthetase TilS n=1 Tax=Rubritepida flocculans TaxID=182403 RepID=UPI000428D131|nr:tRNA lysidine(34) synthetase TilS [Rubritepida flocculans]